MTQRRMSCSRLSHKKTSHSRLSHTYVAMGWLSHSRLSQRKTILKAAGTSLAAGSFRTTTRLPHMPSHPCPNTLSACKFSGNLECDNLDFPFLQATTKTKMAPKSGPKAKGHSKSSKKEDKTLKRKREAEDHDRLKKAIDELVRSFVMAAIPHLSADGSSRTQSHPSQISQTCPSVKQQPPESKPPTSKPSPMYRLEPFLWP